MNYNYSSISIKLTSEVLDRMVDHFVQNLKNNNHSDISIWNRVENILCEVSPNTEYPAFNDTKEIFFSELIGIASGVYILKDPETAAFHKRADFLKLIEVLV